MHVEFRNISCIRNLQGRGFQTRRLRAQVLHSAIGGNDVGQIVVMLLQFHKVRNVEESIAFQANVDESRLHAGQHARYFSFVDGSSEGVLILAFHVDFREQIIFHQAHLGFVGRGRDK